MKVSVKSRGYVKRVRRDSIPFFRVLWSTLAVGVLFAAMPTQADGRIGKINLVLIVHDADGYNVPNPTFTVER